MELKDLDKRAIRVLENCSAPIIGIDGKKLTLEEINIKEVKPEKIKPKNTK